MQDNLFKRTKARTAPPAVASKSNGNLELRINGKPFFPKGDPDMPLLWYLRDVLELTGSKYACGVGVCGSCTVLIDGKARPSCMTPMKSLAGHSVTTIEGLSPGEKKLHALQQAWIDEDAIGCGYCQCGQIMAAAELLARTQRPSDADIDQIRNICRCGMYPRIRRAIKRAAAALRNEKP